MIFKSPIDFSAAEAAHAVKTILPTNLGSAELRAVGGDFKRRAVFSAKVINAEYLQNIRGITQDALSGELDSTTAHLHLSKLAEMLDVEHDDARVDLILETNLATANGYGQFLAANDPLTVEQFPAWELYRVEEKKEPRDWEQRWQFAARASGDVDAARVFEETGRMVALKDSEIWDALGDSGNFDDALDNPYPPFYFRSGVYGIRDIDLEETRELGLLGADEEPTAREIPAFNENFQMTLPGLDAELRSALLKSLGDDVKLDNGVLTLKGNGGTTDADSTTIRSENEDLHDHPDQPGGTGPGYEGIRQALQSTALTSGPAADTASAVDATELQAVAGGTKPLYHAEFSDPANAEQLAAALRPVLPPHMEVAATDGHVFAFDPETVRAITTADPQFYGDGTVLEQIQRVTATEENGELLGYGARSWSEPGAVRLLVKNAAGKTITGFYTRPGLARIYGDAAVRDLGETLGEKLTWKLGGAS